MRLEHSIVNFRRGPGKFSKHRKSADLILLCYYLIAEIFLYLYKEMYLKVLMFNKVMIVQSYPSLTGPDCTVCAKKYDCTRSIKEKKKKNSFLGNRSMSGVTTNSYMTTRFNRFLHVCIRYLCSLVVFAQLPVLNIVALREGNQGYGAMKALSCLPTNQTARVPL